MISIESDNDFTYLIADLIKQLSVLEKYTFKVWVTGSDLPFEFNENCSYHFMQEGMRVINGTGIGYLFYDTISAMEIIKGG